MWLLGPTAMLLTSAIVTAGVVALDCWDHHAYAPALRFSPAMKAAPEKPTASAQMQVQANTAPLVGSAGSTSKSNRIAERELVQHRNIPQEAPNNLPAATPDQERNVLDLAPAVGSNRPAVMTGRAMQHNWRQRWKGHYAISLTTGECAPKKLLEHSLTLQVRLRGEALRLAAPRQGTEH